METVGVVDIGSNTVRLSVVEAFEDGAHCIRYEDKAALRLAARLGSDGTLGHQAAEDAGRTLAHFSRAGESWGVDRWLAVATAAVREASDRDAFLRDVTAFTGIPIRLLSGDEEARLGFLGAIRSLRERDGVCVDIGGGSTEITHFRGRRRVAGVSLPLGAVNAAERFDLRDKAADGALDRLNRTLEAMGRDQAARGPRPGGAAAGEEATAVEGVDWLSPAGGTLVGIGGTMRALAKLDRRRRGYPLEMTHHYILDPSEAVRLRDQLSRLTARERLHLPGMSTERADLIAAGAAILAWVVTRLEPERIVCSGSGLREGIFYDHLGGGGAAGAGADPLEVSAAGLERLYRLPAARGRRLGAIAEQLWTAIGPLAGGAPVGELVRVAARLRKAGSTVSYYNAERHTFYLLREARLFGVDHRERMLLAAAAAFDGPGRTRDRLAPYVTVLQPGDERLASRMGVATAIAEALDLDAAGRAGPIEVSALPSTVRVTTADGPVEGFAAAAAAADDFRKLFGRALSVVCRVNAR